MRSFVAGVGQQLLRIYGHEVLVAIVLLLHEAFEAVLERKGLIR